MGIANIGSFAGGLMRGHLAATEEQRREQEEARRKEDQKFQEEQRGRARQDWKTEDEIRSGIAALPAVGSTQYRVVKNPQAILDLGNEHQYMDEQYTYTPEMRQQALAGLYRSKGREDLAAGAEDRAYTYVQRGREAEDRTYNLGQRQRALGQQAAVDAALLRRSDMLRELATDEDAFVAKYGDLFNRDEFGGPQHQGARLAFASTPQGKVGYYIGADGAVGGQFPVNRQSLMEIVNRLTDAELSAASPEQFSAAQTRGIQRGQLDVQRGQLGVQQGQLGVAQQNANTQEQYRRWLETQPKIMQDGTGRIIAIDPTGQRQLGVFGNARPDPNARNAGFRDPAAYDAAVKEYNDLVVKYQQAQTPTERQNLMRQLSLVEGKIANAMGRPMQIKAPAEGPDLKFVKTDTGGYFADSQGTPRAQFDGMGQFPMIPFGNDPRADKKWPDVQDKLATAGATLAVAVNASGNYQWAFQSKDGRKWSTWQEAVKPPELNNQSPSGQPVGGSATREAAPAPTTPAAAGVGDIPDERILQAFREKGAAGAAEALLGPRPQTRITRGGTSGDVEAQRAYDARWQAIQDRLGQLSRQGAPAAGLRRPAEPVAPATPAGMTPEAAARWRAQSSLD